MLVVCKPCGRHVAASERVCPFCASEREPSTAESAPVRVERTRSAFLVGAAALVTAGGMQVASCGGAYGGPPPGYARSEPDAGGGAPEANTRLVVTPIGAEITVGAAPPDFVAHTHDGKRIRLSDLAGKTVVVFFYPKDETPGCTAEACSFRDAWTALDKGGVVLVGVSTDSDASHRAFAEHHKLPFALISDPDGELAKAFGVPVRLSFTSRQSFMIGKDGRVRRIYRTVDVKGHAAQIQADVGD